MEIRPLTPADLDGVREIDGTIESTRYLHIHRDGEGVALSWRIEERPLPQKLIFPNPLGDDTAFTLRQVAIGSEDGLALIAEHDEAIVALALAQAHPATGTLRIVDLRVDYDHRRQGLASAMVFRMIEVAREASLRAVAARTLTHNLPAAEFLTKLGFELAGLDSQRETKHNPAKESVTLFWYAGLT